MSEQPDNREGQTSSDLVSGNGSFDYSVVDTVARIAVYDDLRSAPRIIVVEPAPTAEFIENIASKVYEVSKQAGGEVPYTVIREVSENFIHAQFSEIVISVLDKGNTIRFSDQGPGIPNKQKAQLPGFTSAVEPMKEYIRGVGSGFPIVKEYLDFSNGTITIEDNLKSGAVVTISLKEEKAPKEPKQKPIQPLIPQLSSREKSFLALFVDGEPLGVTDLVKLTGTPQSSTYVALTHLEEHGLIEKTVGQKRILTEIGRTVAENI